MSKIGIVGAGWVKTGQNPLATVGTKCDHIQECGTQSAEGTLSLPLNKAADLQASAKIIRTAIDEIEGAL